MKMPLKIRDDVPTEIKISAEDIHEGRDVDADELQFAPREYIELVVGVIAGHAMGEAFILRDEVYAHWATDAPTTEDRFMVLRTIEEELMHAREGWRMVRQVEDLLEFVDIVPYDHRSKQSGLEGFQHDVNEWAEHAALCALTDRVGVFQQEEQLDSSYLPYAESIRTAFFPIEKGHAARGRLWLRRLCETDDGRVQAQRAIDIWWPRALDMFGKSTSTRQHRYCYFRLKKRLNQERREAYIETVGAELVEMGLVVPDPLVGRSFL
ncbi:MAG: Phenylacetic acid catabolic protein [Acidimicrobiales bacterium]|nr:Phenylacetic acid catabolic protein [Acidimicrobiales bacterium]